MKLRLGGEFKARSRLGVRSPGLTSDQRQDRRDVHTVAGCQLPRRDSLAICQADFLAVLQGELAAPVVLKDESLDFVVTPVVVIQDASDRLPVNTVTYRQCANRNTLGVLTTDTLPRSPGQLPRSTLDIDPLGDRFQVRGVDANATATGVI